MLSKLASSIKLGISICCAKLIRNYNQLLSLYNFCSWENEVVGKSAHAVILDFEYGNREVLYSWVNDQLGGGTDVPLTYIELGVHKGESINKWSSINKHPDSRFFGFDSFEGLPENWRDVSRQTFDVQGSIPETNDTRVTFVKGWFSETLPQFMSTFDTKNPLVIHCDADLYSSTLFSLILLNKVIKPGTFIIFDEFGDIDHEFAALREFSRACQRKWKLAAGRKNFDKAAVQICS